jgi:hypothetical protein
MSGSKLVASFTDGYGVYFDVYRRTEDATEDGMICPGDPNADAVLLVHKLAKYFNCEPTPEAVERYIDRAYQGRYDAIKSR